jgi:ankyrin repeat protein
MLKAIKRVTGGNEFSEYFRFIRENNIKGINQNITESNIDTLEDHTNKTFLIVACETRNIEMVKVLLQKHPNVLLRDSDNKNALFYAIDNNDITIEIINYILLKNTNRRSPFDLEFYNNLNAPSQIGLTLLMSAVNSENTLLAKTLITNGVDIDAIDKKGMTALMYASRLNTKNSIEIVKLLLAKNAKTDIGDIDGNNALMHASICQNTAAVKLLLDENVQLVDIVNKHGKTALMHASCGWKKENAEIVKLLLDKNANVNIVDNKKTSALMHASITQNFHIVKLLLDKNANVHLVDEYGRTALMYASRARRGNTEIVKLLQNVDGYTIRDCFQYVRENKIVELKNCIVIHATHINTFENDDDTSSYVSFSDEDEEDDDDTSENGHTFLTIACEGGFSEIVTILLTHGANVNLPNSYGHTPLMLACDEGFPEIVTILLKHGANTDIPNYNLDNYTALMMACQRGHVEIVTLLIKHGANVNIRNKAGNTAYTLAQNNNHLHIVRILFDHIILKNRTKRQPHDYEKQGKLKAAMMEMMIPLIKNKPSGTISGNDPQSLFRRGLLIAPYSKTISHIPIVDGFVDIVPTKSYTWTLYPNDKLSEENIIQVDNILSTDQDIVRTIWKMAESKLTHSHTPRALSVVNTSLLEVAKDSIIYIDIAGLDIKPDYAIFRYLKGSSTPFHAIAKLAKDKQRKLICSKRTVYRWVVNLPPDGFCAGMSTHVIKEWEWNANNDLPMHKMIIHLNNSIALPVLKYLHKGGDGRWAGEEAIFPGTITRRKDAHGNPTLEFDHQCDGYVSASKNGEYVVIANTLERLKWERDKLKIDASGWSKVVEPLASHKRRGTLVEQIASRKGISRRIASY